MHLSSCHLTAACHCPMGLAMHTCHMGMIVHNHNWACTVVYAALPRTTAASTTDIPASTPHAWHTCLVKVVHNTKQCHHEPHWQPSPHGCCKESHRCTSPLSLSAAAIHVSHGQLHCWCHKASDRDRCLQPHALINSATIQHGWLQRTVGSTTSGIAVWPCQGTWVPHIPAAMTCSGHPPPW